MKSLASITSRLDRLYRQAERLEARRKAFMGAQANDAEGNAARLRRRGDLHPDKLGREQTPAERTEYAKLTSRRKPKSKGQRKTTPRGRSSVR
jgi:hypothetical protein